MAESRDADRRFRRWLVFVALVGFVARVITANVFNDRTRVGGDAVWYLGIARLLPRGVGFVEPLSYSVLHTRLESASHPPLYPLFLSAIDLIGVHSILAHRIWSCVPAAFTIGVVGLVARELGGRKAGLIAAACTAGSLSLMIQDVNLWSEGLYATSIVCVVWCAYRLVRRPDVLSVGMLAAAVSLSALIRAESALLLVVLLLPLVARAIPKGTARWRSLAVSLLVPILLFGPWFAYNATRFEHPVVLSNGLGPLIASSNCPATYQGGGIGAWGYLCAKGLPRRLPTDESETDVLMRRVGVRFVSNHLDRLPLVVPVRLLRTFGFWRPIAAAGGDLQLDEAGLGWMSYVVAAQYWIYLGFGIMGLRILRQRRQPILALVAPIITVMVITVIGYGTLRFRVAVDVILPILVGVAASSLLARRRPGVRSPSG